MPPPMSSSEGLPNFCTYCKVIGHPITHCHWARRSQRDVQPPRVAERGTVDDGKTKGTEGQNKGVGDGFTLVTHKARGKGKGARRGNKGAAQTVNVRGLVPNGIASKTDGGKNKGIAHDSQTLPLNMKETRNIEDPSTSGTSAAEDLATPPQNQSVPEEEEGEEEIEIDKGEGALVPSTEDQVPKVRKKIENVKGVEGPPSTNTPKENETNVMAIGEGNKAGKGKKSKKKVVGDVPNQPQ